MEKKKNDVSLMPARVLTEATFSLMVIGVGSIVFGCADLVAGFMGFSFLWSWSLWFTYVWAGFLFAIINGSLALKAASLKPHVNPKWTNVIFGFGITTLLFHIFDMTIVILSVASLAPHDTRIERNTTESVYTGNDTSRIYNATYYYQSPLVAEAPRLVIVSVLLALDIWLFVVAFQLRHHFRPQPLDDTSAIVIANEYGELPRSARSSGVFSVSVPNTGALTVQMSTLEQAQVANAPFIEHAKLQARCHQALVASGIFSLIYGAGELLSGLFAISEWNSDSDHVRWFSFGFTCVAFIFAVTNGLLALAATCKKPTVSTIWNEVAISVGIVSVIAYVVAMGPCLYTLIVAGPIGPTLDSVVDGGAVVGKYDIYYKTYESRITPAVPEAARLVTLAVLIAMTVIQIVTATKLKSHAKMIHAAPAVSLK